MEIKRNNKINKYLREYYTKYAKFDIPSINMREFGVGWKKKIEARHISFDTTDSFRSYMVTNVPMYVSYSGAYYEFPNAKPIERKNWLGADLIFDMDLPGGKYELYSKFGKIHDELVRLVKDFLINDFGINMSDIVPVFSGSKGFHVHVRSNKFKSLGSGERREIVDYISGIGFSYTSFMLVEKIGRSLKITGPHPNDGGYPGRFARMVVHILKTKPETILSKRYTKPEKIGQIVRGIERGNWSFFPGKEPLNLLKPAADEVPISSIPLDASVSYDIKRLIRVPNSIHGGSGFVAAIIDKNKLESFSPFTNARMPNFEKWTIKFEEGVPKIESEHVVIGGYKKGQTVKMPDNEAIFYVLKGSAVIL